MIEWLSHARDGSSAAARQTDNLEAEYSAACQARGGCHAIAIQAYEREKAQSQQERERQHRWEANPMRPDWAKIVLSNPNILSQICSEQFKSFDVDKSGE